MNRVLTLMALLVFVLSVSLSFAQDVPVKRNPIIIKMLKHDVSPELRTIPPAPRSAHVRRIIPNRMKPMPKGDPSVRFAPDDESEDIAGDNVQNFFGATAMPALSKNFEGIGEGLAGYFDCCAPPDTNGDVGPNDYVQTVNLDFAIFNKTTGAITFGPAAMNTLWAGFGGDCESDNDGDPTVNYDQLADRWVIAQFAVEGATSKECVAVSTTGNPAGAYNRYAFDFGTDFPDYPKLAVWPDAYYATYNNFGAFFRGTVCAMDRTNMLAGNAANQICFDDDGDGGALASDLEGTTLPPGGSPNFVFQISYNNFNTTTLTMSGLKLWKFHVDFATPANSTFTGPTIVPTTLNALTCGKDYVFGSGRGSCIKEPGTKQRLESLADRIMHRVTYRNFGTYESILINHANRLEGSTVGGKPGSVKTGIKWYELRDPNGTHTLFQQALYAPNKRTARWMASMAQDKLGNIAMGYSVSNKKDVIFPGIDLTGRLVTDPINQMSQGEAVMTPGTGSQQINLGRWGDYSDMTVDPSDDCTFWYTNEYIAVNGTFNWHTRIASFKFPSCL